MTIKIDLGGKPRKALAQNLGEWLGYPVRYCGAPTFAYEIGGYTLTKDADLVCSETTEDTLYRLTSYLYDNGFVCDFAPIVVTAKFKIRMPIEGFDDAAADRLKKIISGKESLLKKALGVGELTFEIDEANGTVNFPWVNLYDSPDFIEAKVTLVSRMYELAKECNRASGKENTAENEKYTFRCFLLRLGFIGDEYKGARKLLLANFEGSAAFKNGRKGVE